MNLDWLWRFLTVGDYDFSRTFGMPRSDKWPQVRDAFVRANPFCAVCKSKKNLNVHHKLPFHINPALELDPHNLITLCRDHHFLFGHFLNWSSYNKDVDVDCNIWRGKIETRPAGGSSDPNE